MAPVVGGALSPEGATGAVYCAASEGTSDGYAVLAVGTPVGGCVTGRRVGRRLVMQTVPYRLQDVPGSRAYLPGTAGLPHRPQAARFS